MEDFNDAPDISWRREAELIAWDIEIQLRDLARFHEKAEACKIAGTIRKWLRESPDDTPSRQLQWVQSVVEPPLNRHLFHVARPYEVVLDAEQEEWIHSIWDRIVDCAWQKHQALVDYKARVRNRRNPRANSRQAHRGAQASSADRSESGHAISEGSHHDAEASGAEQHDDGGVSGMSSSPARRRT